MIRLMYPEASQLREEAVGGTGNTDLCNGAHYTGAVFPNSCALKRPTLLRLLRLRKDKIAFFAFRNRNGVDYQEKSTHSSV